MTSDYMISYFPSNLNNQLDFVVAKQDESEGGSVSKFSLSLVFDLLSSQSYEINLIKKIVGL